jgi:enoyl-CoA hydratase
MSVDSEILFEERGRAGVITLNRPHALNALTLSMIRAMQARLLQWAGDSRIERVVIRSAAEKAFCAGGDIRQLREWGLAHDPNAVAFYREEYQLNHFIKRYPKPYVALIDGVVMGGGVGIAIHGSHRICGERTVFAMPETAIGLFPDVGATFFLPRLPGSLGSYLGLTGARLGQSDLQWCGISTQSTASSNFDRLLDDLAEAPDLDAACASFARHTEEPTLPPLMPAIDRCFGADSVEGILSRLAREAGDHAGWASETIATLKTKSPLSLHITLRQMREGIAADFEECMRIEFRVVNRVLQGADFYEGIRAVIIDKDNRPRWSHRSVHDASVEEVASYFAPLGAGELEFL